MSMKKLMMLLLVLGLTGMARVFGQVQVVVSFSQDQYLPGESLVTAVKIVNRSGARVTFGTDPMWLTFDVETLDSKPVRRNLDPEVTGAFDLESSQQGIKRVDLSRAFELKEFGRYRVTATVHMPAWGKDFTSKPAEVSIVPGAKVWEQAFGVTATPGQPPEMRKYVVSSVSYMRTQLRLYATVASEDGSQIIKVCVLGPKVSYGSPDTQVDTAGRLHVLWQDGASMFAYRVVTPDGELVTQEAYDYVKARPRLAVDASGNVVVNGGIRRLKSAEAPVVRAPNELPPVRMPSELPPTAAKQ